MHKKRFNCTTTYGVKPQINSGKSPSREERNQPDSGTMESLIGQSTCTSKAYQRATVSVPVAVKPFSMAGKPRTYCSSKPVLRDVRCQGGCNYERYYNDEDCYKDYDKGCYRDTSKSEDETCYFVFTQEICIEVPVRFGAVVHADQPFVECHEVSTIPCQSQSPDNHADEADEDEW